MRKSRLTEEQIIQILKKAEAGMSVADVCRQHSISDTTLYKWKSKYGGLEVSEARRLRQLEEEHARLKRLVADQALDIVVLREVLQKTRRARRAQRGHGIRDQAARLLRAAGV